MKNFFHLPANRLHDLRVKRESVSARPASETSERIVATRGKFPQFSAVPIAIFGMVFWLGVLLWLLRINH